MERKLAKGKIEGISMDDITNIEISEYQDYSEVRLIYLKHFEDIPNYQYSFNSVHETVKDKVKSFIDKHFDFNTEYFSQSFTPVNAMDDYGDLITTEKESKVYKTSVEVNKKVVMRSSNYEWLVFFSQSPLDDNFIKELEDMIEEGSNNRINTSVHMLTQAREMELTDFKIDDKYADLDLDLHYNDGFRDMHNRVLEKVKNESVGLFLFHGHPGTGKTTYLRHLIRTMNKRVIFIPPNIGASLSDPSMLNFLMDYPNSILMIEDAEKLIASRDSFDGGAVSDLLNLSDGILGDCLRFQVICTFNTETKNLDKALLREGRLLEKYEFGKLKKDKANQLLKHLGKKERNESLSLAEIYNEKVEGVSETNSIGFKS